MVNVSARIPPEVERILIDHADDLDRSFSTEARLALEGHALMIVLASLFAPGARACRTESRD